MTSENNEVGTQDLEKSAHVRISKYTKTINIDLMGRPGAGKSVVMHGLVEALKKMGLNAECTPEFVKDLVYEGVNIDKLGGQLFILAEQNRRLARVIDKVDFVVTDCPLTLIGSYVPKDYPDGLHEFLHNLNARYSTVSYFINRNDEYDFENEGRYHDDEKSKEQEVKIKKYLKEHNINYKELIAGDSVVSSIIDDLIENNVITLDHLQKSRTPSVRKKYANK